MKKQKTFYRVAHIKTKNGCWYDQNGNFTGLIHQEFNFLTNTKLQMPFNKKIAGYLSATDSKKDLYKWFTKNDIKRLKAYGYKVMKYKSKDYFIDSGHYVINKDNSTLLKIYK